MNRTQTPPFEIMGPAALADARARMARIRRLAWFLNAAFRIPGIRTRFGVDTLVGLVPGAGDTLGALLSLYIVHQAWKLGVPRPLLVRMLGNVAIELVVGVVPVFGDLFDTVFKADLRNVRIIERALGSL